MWLIHKLGFVLFKKTTTKYKEEKRCEMCERVHCLQWKLNEVERYINYGLHRVSKGTTPKVFCWKHGVSPWNTKINSSSFVWHFPISLVLDICLFTGTQVLPQTLRFKWREVRTWTPQPQLIGQTHGRHGFRRHAWKTQTVSDIDNID